MKRWKKVLPLLLLLLVLAGLLLAYYILTHPKETGEETAPGTEMLLGGLTADRIAEISYETEEGTGTHFRREGEKWVIPEEPEIEPDSQKVYAFCAGTTGVGLKRVIENASGELEKFGLTVPFVTVKITDTDGKETEMRISQTFPSANVVYIMLNGDPSRIYVCAPSVRANFEKTPEDFLPDASES